MAEAGADLGRLSPEARHRTRILAKRLRYAADVFDQLFDEHPKRAKRFLDALEALLETLGELNDIASAKVMAPAFPEASHLMVQEAARERSLLKAAGKAYKAFEAAKPYWPVET